LLLFRAYQDEIETCHIVAKQMAKPLNIEEVKISRFCRFHSLDHDHGEKTRLAVTKEEYLMAD